MLIYSVWTATLEILHWLAIPVTFILRCCCFLWMFHTNEPSYSWFTKEKNFYYIRQYGKSSKVRSKISLYMLFSNIRVGHRCHKTNISITYIAFHTTKHQTKHFSYSLAAFQLDIKPSRTIGGQQTKRSLSKNFIFWAAYVKIISVAENE